MNLSQRSTKLAQSRSAWSAVQIQGVAEFSNRNGPGHKNVSEHVCQITFGQHRCQVESGASKTSCWDRINQCDVGQFELSCGVDLDGVAAAVARAGNGEFDQVMRLIANAPKVPSGSVAGDSAQGNTGAGNLRMLRLAVAQ